MSSWGAGPWLPGSSGEGGALTSGSGTTSGGGGGGAGGALTGVVDSGVSKASSESELLTEREGETRVRQGRTRGDGGLWARGNQAPCQRHARDHARKGAVQRGSREGPLSPPPHPSEHPGSAHQPHKPLPGPRDDEQKHQSSCGPDTESRSLQTMEFREKDSFAEPDGPTALPTDGRLHEGLAAAGRAHRSGQRGSRRPCLQRPLPRMKHRAVTRLSHE